MRTFMGIDIGTTNSKVGICDESWTVVELRVVPNAARITASGRKAYDSRALWETLRPEIRALMRQYRPVSVGITGMAEPGVVVERRTGRVLTDMLHWADGGSASYSGRVSADGRDEERFLRTGMHNSYKYAVYKLLTERNDRRLSLEGTVFLQAAPYLLFCLTGEFATDPTLALRTYAYDLTRGCYDGDFLASLGLPADCFPPVLPSGRAAGTLRRELAEEFGCKHPVPVAVCGHDHMCAAAAVGAESGVFLSLGTTGVLLGDFPCRALTGRDWKTGYSYGMHVLKDRMTWLGALQAMGSSVDWCKELLGFSGGDYAAFDALLAQGSGKVGEILFYPYLSGSGAPELDSGARGCFCGLDARHGREEIAHAVLEGLAYELQTVLAAAPAGRAGDTIRAVGGGTRNHALLQVLADALGREIVTPDCEQAALTGAAMAASGIPMEGIRRSNPRAFQAREAYRPDAARHRRYKKTYEEAYLPGRQLARRVGRREKSVEEGD